MSTNENDIKSGDDGSDQGSEQIEPKQEDSDLDYANWNGVDVMESLCMSCGKNGETRLMLHKIPYFRELIIASFECEHCGERNNEVTFGGEIQDQGCRYELQVTKESDMDRQLIKSDSAMVRIAELDFEIPPMTQRGGISTVEGVIKKAAENLAMFQEQRMEQMPEIGVQVAQIIGQLTMISARFASSFPFTLIVDDPAGNSFVENPLAPQIDPHMHIRYYSRSREQDISLGLPPEQDTGVYKDDKDNNFGSLMQGEFGKVKDGKEDHAGAGRGGALDVVAAGEEDDRPRRLMILEEDGVPASSSSLEVPSSNENRSSASHGTTHDGDGSSGSSGSGGGSDVVCIPSPCPHCMAEGENRTAMTTIPHFKEILIMAFNCAQCGFRTNDVKGGGGVPTYGTEVTLSVTSSKDLTRDLLKSDTAMVTIPELELELQHGTLGGVFTTVEGLLQKIIQKLLESNPFAVGDSSVQNHSKDHSAREHFIAFIEKLKAFAKGDVFPFTLLLRDPLGNSFVSAPIGSFLPPEMDANLKISDFVRTFDENEDLGLNDINVDHYMDDVDSSDPAAATTTREKQEEEEEEVAGPHLQSQYVLPDRLKYVHHKGADHPTPFAMGTNEHDNTAGGMFIGSSSSNITPATSNINSTFPPSSAGETHHQQQQQDSDKPPSPSQSEEVLCSSAPVGWRADRIDTQYHLTPELVAGLYGPQSAKKTAATIASASSSGSGISSSSSSSNLPTATNSSSSIGGGGGGGGGGVPYNSRRVFSEADLTLVFDPREEFAGRREGFVFRLGAQGLGYYSDPHQHHQQQQQQHGERGLGDVGRDHRQEIGNKELSNDAEESREQSNLKSSVDCS